MSAIRQVKVVEVLETVSVYGKGVEGDPVREIVEYWTLNEENEMKLLLTIDPCEKSSEV
jgi:hypothetical protein